MRNRSSNMRSTPNPRKQSADCTGTPEVLARTEGAVVLNKPAGLPVHAGPRGGPSVEDWFGLLSRRRDGPWLAHRLDADTAGCLVVALRRAALLDCQRAFADGQAEKRYWAVVQGAPPQPAGTRQSFLERQSTVLGWRMAEAKEGILAVTDWRLLSQADGFSWLELAPRTGRTHQIRVHCAALGCPILGDPVYGAGGAALHLLARSIRLPLQPVLQAQAPLPPHMRARFAALGWGSRAGSDGS